VRELHVVAVSDDGRHVVLATSPDAKKGTFRVPLDARLRSAVQGRLTPRPVAIAPAGQTGLSVREMQARLRAGESAEEIAASAGIAVERVERFAGPVWSEQEKILQRARATPLLHSRRGLSALPLGEAVDAHFAQIDSLRPESVAWSARREEAGTWIVEVSYVARARTRSGSWRYDSTAGTLVAADSVSASLGHSETTDGAPAPPAPKRRGSSKPAAASGRAAAAAPVAGPGKRAAVPARVTAKAAPSAPAADRPRRAAPAAPPRAPAAVRTTVGTKAAPVVAKPGAAKTVADTGSPTTSRGRKAPTKTPKPSKAPKPSTAAPKPPAAAKPAADVPPGPPTLRVVPALDQQPRQPPGGRRAGTPRASVPAWADVLLSTSPPAAEDAQAEEASSD
jgi:hypothetical protein